jgi:alpha-L-arabinofuranosidase
LTAVNTSHEHALATTFSVAGLAVEPRATVATLTAPSLQAANSFATPDAVKVTRSDVVAGASFTVKLPPHSVSVITLSRR